MDVVIGLAFGTLGKISLGKNDSNGKSSTTLDDKTNYCDNKWHHIAVVSDGSLLVVYADNVKINTFELTALQSVQWVNNYIGRSLGQNVAYSTMQIDDFRVYATTLTNSDIATVFNYKNTQKNIVASNIQPFSVPAVSMNSLQPISVPAVSMNALQPISVPAVSMNSNPVPLIWYKFDTLSSTKVSNYGSAGSSLDATLNNGAVVTTYESPVGPISLNLTNTPVKLSVDPTGQYLSIPPFTLGGPFSFSCWFRKYSDANEKNGRIFEFSLSSEKIISVSFDRLGKIIITKVDSNGKSSTTLDKINYCDNKWHHIVISSDGKLLVFYVDNVKINALKYTALQSLQRVNNYIGRTIDKNVAYSTIRLDDFRVYTTTLTNSDIATLFNYKNIKKNSAAASKSVVENFEDSWNAYQIEDSWNANPLQTIGILIVLFVIIKFLFFKH